MTDQPEAISAAACSATPPPEFAAPTVQPASYDPPVVVALSMAEVPIPRLMDMRRDLISALQTVETALGLPPEKRAIRTRAERRGIIEMGE